MTASKEALAHIRVLDLSRVLAGPWAGQTLADMGADVIKVEQPGKGDDTRHWGPPYMDDDEGRRCSESAYFLCANRGKRSVCVDIKTAKGQQQLHKLVAESDIVIENFKVGQLAKYNLDYETLSRINPSLIYCSITGFGQTGPYADRPGYDFLVQAMSGLMSVTGDQGGEPQKVGVAVTDLMAGLYCTIGVLAALAERTVSGKGQYIDLSLLDVAVTSMANQASNYLVGGDVPTAMGNAHPNIVPYQSFTTQNGHCIVAVGNDVQFEQLCKVIGRADLSRDPLYGSNKNRVENRASLIPLIADSLLDRPTEEWLSKLANAGVPAAPINNMAQVFDDPQVVSRGMQISIEHPLQQALSLVASPLRFSRTPIVYRRPPPLLGEHTDEVLSDVEESMS